MTKALTVIPTYLRSAQDLEVLLEAVTSLRRTAPEAEVLLVDDASPASHLVEVIAEQASDLNLELHRQEENAGFSRTVNVGLRRALQEGKDAVLVNADIAFIEEGWLDVMQAQRRADDAGLADVVGGLLIYPNGLIQHAGIFFSLLHRCFEHIYKYAPQDLPEAKFARRCPVTGALQFIRHETLATVGVYDEKFRMGWEDVDYCIRVFQNGGECVYQPRARAYHHESLFRGQGSDKVAKWQEESWDYFRRKHQATSFAEWVPTIV